MKKIEEEFIKEFDMSLGNQKSFEDIKDKINIGRFQKQKTSSVKALYSILGTVTAFILLAAIIIPSAIILSSKEVTPTTGDNIFDDDNITIEVLKERDCLFYENLVFAEDSKNHVFVTKEMKITEHYSYDKVAFNEDSFDNLSNKNIIDAVEYIGIPTYEGISNEFSLDYSCVDGYIRRLKLSKSDDKLLIDDVEILDKTKLETWFDKDKTDLPSLEQCQKIKIGMSFDEVIRAIGKPQRDVGYGTWWLEFNMNNGSVMDIWLDLNTWDPKITTYDRLYVWQIDYDVPPPFQWPDEKEDIYLNDVYPWINELQAEDICAVRYEHGFLDVAPGSLKTISYSTNREDIENSYRLLFSRLVPIISSEGHDVEGGGYVQYDFFTKNGETFTLSVSHDTLLVGNQNYRFVYKMYTFKHSDRDCYSFTTYADLVDHWDTYEIYSYWDESVKIGEYSGLGELEFEIYTGLIETVPKYYLKSDTTELIILSEKLFLIGRYNTTVYQITGEKDFSSLFSENVGNNSLTV